MATPGIGHLRQNPGRSPVDGQSAAVRRRSPPPGRRPARLASYPTPLQNPLIPLRARISISTSPIWRDFSRLQILEKIERIAREKALHFAHEMCTFDENSARTDRIFCLRTSRKRAWSNGRAAFPACRRSTWALATIEPSCRSFPRLAFFHRERRQQTLQPLNGPSEGPFSFPN